ncbi:hypothetical protein SK128_000817, partial [Halocaridina rubra]
MGNISFFAVIIAWACIESNSKCSAFPIRFPVLNRATENPSLPWKPETAAIVGGYDAGTRGLPGFGDLVLLDEFRDTNSLVAPSVEVLTDDEAEPHAVPDASIENEIGVANSEVSESASTTRKQSKLGPSDKLQLDPESSSSQDISVNGTKVIPGDESDIRGNQVTVETSYNVQTDGNNDDPDVNYDDSPFQIFPRVFESSRIAKPIGEANLEDSKTVGPGIAVFLDMGTETFYNPNAYQTFD